MKPYVYLSYGMPKSGSTLAFELTKAVFEQNSYPQTRLSGLVDDKHATNFIGGFSDEVVERLWTAVERIGYPIVVKTHGRLTPAARRLLENGMRSDIVRIATRAKSFSLCSMPATRHGSWVSRPFPPRPRSNSPPSA